MMQQDGVARHLDKILKMSKTLGDETRLAIYRFLTTRRQPVTVAEVAQQFSLHPNAARGHLTRLEEAGLAVSYPDHAAATGRPPRLYRPAAAGMSPIFEPSAYRALSMMLLELCSGLPGMDAARLAEFGRQWGGRHASRYPLQGQVEQLDPDYILAGLVRTLESWGFSAELAPASPGQPAAVLVRRCAFADQLALHRERICPLIHGVLDGMLAAIRPDLRFTLHHRSAVDKGGSCRIGVG
ncbi:MAG: helix-turn-helix domain-containing protein [Deltaproteobacteria bacterium]|nr:helix-turn-helix domain-containing protein [Deltaproteobacteria bacterium]